MRTKKASFFATAIRLSSGRPSLAFPGENMRRTLAVSCNVPLALTLIASFATSASAEGLIGMKRLSATLASEAVTEAVVACAKNGYAVTAVIVTIDGVRGAARRRRCRAHAR